MVAPTDTFNEKLPCASLIVPPVLPFTAMLAPATGLAFWSVIFPLMFFCCANAIAGKSNNSQHNSNILDLFCISVVLVKNLNLKNSLLLLNLKPFLNIFIIIK